MKIVSRLFVSSAQRDTVAYPSSSDFVIHLQNELKLVTSVELLKSIVPNQNNVSDEPYLILDVKELNDDTFENNGSEGFAMLPTGTTAFVNNTGNENDIVHFRTPKDIFRFTIKIKDVSGNAFDFGNSGTTTLASQPAFLFRITQLVPGTVPSKM